MQLSPHFHLSELTVSQTAARRGIPNSPDAAMIAQLKRTAARMEQVRAILGSNPILISSGYRSPAVNKAVRGSRTSAHMTGHAVDFTCPGFGSPYQVALKLSQELPDFDQLIQEFGQWVHVGFGPGQRNQLLTAAKVNGRTVYSPGIRP